MSNSPSHPSSGGGTALSSAASCIQLSLNGFTFHPIFTHQCFDREEIPGYVPALESAYEEDSESPNQPLSVHVKLAPSCRKCAVSIAINPPQKQKLKHPDNDTNDDESNKTKDGHRKRKLVRFGSSEDDTAKKPRGGEDNVAPDLPRETPSSPWTPQDIMERMKTALPLIAHQHVFGQGSEEPSPQGNARDVDVDHLSEPFGTILETYSISKPDTDDKEEFVLTLADPHKDGPAVTEYHNQVQKLALWFIESADGVDISSTVDGGYWKVLYLFQRTHDTQQSSSLFSLLGYMTLYHFISPFRRPRGGIVLRICQALIFPPYQRAGHGRRMMKALYQVFGVWSSVDTGEEKRDDIVEVNVEDPAPEFVALRDRVDYETFRDSLPKGTDAGKPLVIVPVKYTQGSVQDDRYFTPLPESEAIAAADRARVTPRQVHIAYELWKLEKLEAKVQPMEMSGKTKEMGTKVDELRRQYRLMVKKRLLATHSEDIGELEAKEERQALLERLFRETLQHYGKLILR